MAAGQSKEGDSSEVDAKAQLPAHHQSWPCSWLLDLHGEIGQDTLGYRRISTMFCECLVP